jgi:hypothetical protein
MVAILLAVVSAVAAVLPAQGRRQSAGRPHGQIVDVHSGHNAIESIFGALTFVI